MRSKIADTAQTTLIGYSPYFLQQIAHRATHGETGPRKQITLNKAKRVAAPFFRAAIFLFIGVQCFYHQSYAQSKSTDKAFAFVYAVQLCHSIFEFSEQLDLAFIHCSFERCVMSENQLSEPVAFAVLFDVAFEWVYIAVE